MPRRTRGELNALAKSAYQGDLKALVALGSLSPAEKHYLARREEFQHFIVALMFDAVIGNERVTKSQRAAAAWFYRVIKDHSDSEKDLKRGRIPDEAEVVDAGGGE